MAHLQLSFILWVFFFLFAISWAAPMAYGGSQARSLNRSCSHRPMPEPQQRMIRAASATYTTAHSNARSLKHWARPGIEPATSWFLVGFINHYATTGTPISYYFHKVIKINDLLLRCFFCFSPSFQSVHSFLCLYCLCPIEFGSTASSFSLNGFCFEMKLTLLVSRVHEDQDYNKFGT